MNADVLQDCRASLAHLAAIPELKGKQVPSILAVDDAAAARTALHREVHARHMIVVGNGKLRAVRGAPDYHGLPARQSNRLSGERAGFDFENYRHASSSIERRTQFGIRLGSLAGQEKSRHLGELPFDSFCLGHQAAAISDVKRASNWRRLLLAEEPPHKGRASGSLRSLKKIRIPRCLLPNSFIFVAQEKLDEWQILTVRSGSQPL